MKKTKRNFSIAKLETVSRVLKSISHPVKLEILEILEAEEPLDVSTLCARLNCDCETSMLSHHLSKMKDNGILISDKRGKQVFYSIADRGMLKIFDCMEKTKLL